MANPIWPLTLPSPGVAMNGADTRPVVFNQMDGRDRQRRRWTGKKQEYNVTFDVNETELATLQTFVDTTLKGGSLYFDIDLSLNGVFQTETVRFKGGKFTKSYRPVNHWAITAIISLEIEQGVNDPDQTFQVQPFLPEFLVTGDTLLGEEHRNALIRVQGVTDVTPIVLSIPFADSPSELLPFGIQHEGSDGDVIIRMLEEGDTGGGIEDDIIAAALFWGEADGTDDLLDKTTNGNDFNENGVVTQRTHVGVQSRRLETEAWFDKSTSLISLTGSFHIVAYVNYTLDAENRAEIIGAGQPMGDHMFDLRIFNENLIMTWSNDGSTFVNAVELANATNGNWHFVEAYYDDSLDEVAVAIDGGSFTKSSTTGSMFQPALEVNRQMTIGRHHAGFATLRKTEFDLSRIGIFNRLLTSGERSHLYNGGTPRFFPFA